MIPFRGLRDAKHYTGSLSNPDNNYTERNITYDRNGNVLSMTRSQTSPQDITMTYSGNRLASYCDSEQFIYDSNGNCCFDPTTGLEYSYNFLNLPCTVLDGEEMQLHYTYFADGTKYSVMRDFNEGYVYVGPFVYKIHSDYDYPFLESVSSEEGRLVCDESSRTWRDCWFTKDHIGNVRTVLDLSKSTSAPLSDIIVEQDNYLPFGTKSANPALFGSDNRYRLAGNEEQRLNNFTTTLTDFGARSYNPTICRWMTIDPLAEKSHSQSPYNFCVNNPIIYIDFDGRDTVLVSDQSIRPEDSGPGSVTYTAEIYVIQQGQISGPYRGSSYPNSVSNTDNRPAWNTINSGSHNFNNASGHRNGTEQGLNIDDSNNGSRTTSGTNTTGQDVTMTGVNVHSGRSSNGNYNSRGSHGCVTIHPDDANDFFYNFQWTNGGNTGTSTGTIIIDRSITPAEITSERKKKE